MKHYRSYYQSFLTFNVTDVQSELDLKRLLKLEEAEYIIKTFFDKKSILKYLLHLVLYIRVNNSTFTSLELLSVNALCPIFSLNELLIIIPVRFYLLNVTCVDRTAFHSYHSKQNS